MSNWIKNTLILLPILGGAAIAAFYLWKDYSLDHSRTAKELSDKPVVGVVLGVTENVKRKSSESLYWNSIDNNEAIYHLDSIRTGANSFATIRTSKTGEVELNENSLIVIDSEQDELSIEFKTGLIQTNSKNLKVKLQDKTINISGQAKLKTNVDNQTEVSVQSGQATLVGEGKQVKLEKDSLLTIDKDGSVQSVKMAILLNTPKDLTTISTNDPQIMYPFTWTVINKSIDSQFFQLSKDPSFKKGKVLTRTSNRAIKAPVSQGINYWRVGWKKGNKNYYTETRTIRLQEDNRIQLVDPKPQTIFEFEKNQSNKIYFSWNSEKQAQVFVLDVAKDKLFKSIIQTKTSADTHYTIENFKPGKYHWRIQGFDQNNKLIGRSRAQTFLVKELLPSLPHLISPRNGTRWTLNDPIHFKWDSVKGASFYKITIAKDSYLKRVTKTSTSQEPAYIWDWSQTGPYYWVVEALNASNQPISRSLTYKVEISSGIFRSLIELVSPPNQAEVSRDRKGTIDPVVFKWKTHKPIKGHFDLIISTDPKFEKAKKKDKIIGKETALTFDKSNNYFWKVQWTNPDNPKEVEESEIRVIKFRMSSRLPAPALIEPLHLSKKYTAKPKPLDFRWREVKGAKFYRLRVHRETAKGLVPVFNEISTVPKLKSSAVDAGKYIWSVTAMDEEQMEGAPSEKRRFEMILKKELTAPKLNKPVVK